MSAFKDILRGFRGKNNEADRELYIEQGQLGCTSWDADSETTPLIGTYTRLVIREDAVFSQFVNLLDDGDSLASKTLIAGSWFYGEFSGTDQVLDSGVVTFFR